VDWYFGADAARQACLKYHVQIPPEGAECHAYYIHDLHIQRGGVISAAATVSSQTQTSVQDVPMSLDQLAALMQQPGGSSRLYKITISGGQITDITGIYRP
jgi:hypothetical protein